MIGGRRAARAALVVALARVGLNAVPGDAPQPARHRYPRRRVDDRADDLRSLSADRRRAARLPARTTCCVRPSARRRTAGRVRSALLPLAFVADGGLRRAGALSLVRSFCASVSAAARGAGRGARARPAPGGRPGRALVHVLDQHHHHFLSARLQGAALRSRSRTAIRCARGLGSRRPRWPCCLRRAARRRPRRRRLVPAAAAASASPRRARRDAARSACNEQRKRRRVTLSEMKERRTIYIVRAKSFEGDTIAGRTDTGSGRSSARKSRSSTATARKP